MKHILGQKLPSMAISTIKYENGKPVRAKYRIVALGNLDHHQWHKSEVFAPVLSQMELRLLVAQATKYGIIPKTADFKQAFCQSVLPTTEKYVLTPPANCPLTPPNTYWILKRTLYGLQRSPKHWFDKATSIFRQLGLQPCPNSPCLFTGTLIDNAPPIYVGLYVDDCIYFSQDPSVEKAFEESLSTVMNNKITFMGNVSNFLGIKFDCVRDNNDDLSIYLSQTSFIDTSTSIVSVSVFFFRSRSAPSYASLNF